MSDDTVIQFVLSGSIAPHTVGAAGHLANAIKSYEDIVTPAFLAEVKQFPRLVEEFCASAIELHGRDQQSEELFYYGQMKLAEELHRTLRDLGGKYYRAISPVAFETASMLFEYRDLPKDAIFLTVDQIEAPLALLSTINQSLADLRNAANFLFETKQPEPEKEDLNQLRIHKKPQLTLV